MKKTETVKKKTEEMERTAKGKKGWVDEPGGSQ
jgi:hypothetical protein